MRMKIIPFLILLLLLWQLRSQIFFIIYFHQNVNKDYSIIVSYKKLKEKKGL